LTSCELTLVDVEPSEDWGVKCKAIVTLAMECRPTVLVVLIVPIVVVVIVGEPDLSGYLIPLEGQEPALGAPAIPLSLDTTKNTI
jgi:hypothetical protein